MKRFASYAVAALAGAALVTSANAASISDSDSFSNVITELSAETLTVDLFDDLGGTRILNSVTVEVAGSINADGTVTNNAANPQSFQFTETVEIFQGTASGPASLQTLNIFPFFGGTIVGQEVYTNVPPAGSETFGPHSANGGDSFILNAPGDVNLFIGPGTFSYDFDTLIGQAFAGGGGNVSSNIATLANATLTVTYDFDNVTTTPVPEPGTVLLLGTGLIGLVGYARRRKTA